MNKDILVLPDLIDKETNLSYQNIYDDFISGTISIGSHRRDQKGEDGLSKTESISQIMVPARFFPGLLNSMTIDMIWKKT